MKQTLTPEQMRHLSELGLSTRNASMCLIRDTEGNRHLSVHDEYCYEVAYLNPIPVYTLADIMEMLPSTIYHKGVYLWLEMGKSNFYGTTDTYYVSYEALTDEYAHIQFGDNNSNDLIDVAYEMLCWCIEHKYIETKEEQRCE